MILVLLVVITLISYFNGVYAQNRRVANGIRLICDILLIGVLTLMVGNDTFHWGMQPQTTNTTTMIESANSNNKSPLLLQRPLGTSGKEQVYIYKKATNNKLQHTNPDKTIDKIKRTNNQAQLVSQKQVWQYKNKFYRLMFGIAGNEGRRIKTINTFYLPQNWLVLSPRQAKKLAIQLHNPQVKTQITQSIKQKIQQALTTTIQKDPKMSKMQQQALTKSLAAKYQRQALEHLVK